MTALRGIDSIFRYGRMCAFSGKMHFYQSRQPGLRVPTRFEPPPDDGCIIRAKSTSSNAPFFQGFTFPAPPSSAGVPMIHTFPGDLPSRMQAPEKPPSNTLRLNYGPHPCPTPFNASYSARKATVGPGFDPSFQPGTTFPDLRIPVPHGIRAFQYITDIAKRMKFLKSQFRIIVDLSG